jgi:hypothetical protein
MDRDTQLIYEAYLAEADDELSTEVTDETKKKVYDEVKKAAEKVEKAGTDELTKAEKRKIEDLEAVFDKESEGMSALDKVQIALDVGGLGSLSPEPIGQGVGFASDSANATISLARMVGSGVTGDMGGVKKHFANMGLSLLGLIPYIGDAASTGLKAGREVAKGASKTGAFSKAAGKQFSKGIKGQKASKAAAGGASLSKELGHLGIGAGKLVGKPFTGGKLGLKGAEKVTKAAEKGTKADKAIKIARATAVKGAILGGKGSIERGEDDELGPIIDVPGTVEPAPEENTALISPDHFRQRFARKPAA